MVKVIVKNNTSVNVKIQEGNAGVFVTRHVLKSNRAFTLQLDPNATYREYVLIKLPDNRTLDPMFSSDDVIGLRKILIKEDRSVDPPTFSWKGIVFGQKSEENLDQVLQGNDGAQAVTPAIQPVGAAANGLKAHVGWVQRLKNFFS